MDKNTHLLVVDDDRDLRTLLAEYLDSNGLRTLTATNGSEMRRVLEESRVDLIVLDLTLPGEDGLTLCRNLRATSSVPVIMLTVRAGEAEKVRALDTGANDYVTKPFGTQELMARVRALLRTRSVPSDGTPPVFDDGHLRVDLVRREVALQGEPVALTRKEYALLSLLLRNAGRVVTQPQILQEIWGPTHQHDTHYLRILVGKLRHKLGDSALDSRYLFTEPGVGLRFKG